MRKDAKKRTAMALVILFVFSLILIYGPKPPHTASPPAFSQLANKSNALFGIQNSAQYVFYGSIGPYTQGVGGLRYYLANGYGLNFTYPIMGGNNETSVYYNLTVPRWAENYSQPVAVLVSVLQYSNSTYIQFPHAKNGTVYFNRSNYYVLNGSYGIRANSSTVWINMPGAESSIITIRPIYGSLELSQFNVAYKNYLVKVTVYGLNKTYDANYTARIGLHMYKELQAV